MAEEQEQLVEALGYYIHNLEISIEYDASDYGPTLRCLALLWRKSGDDAVLDETAKVLDFSVDQVRELFASIPTEAD